MFAVLFLVRRIQLEKYDVRLQWRIAGVVHGQANYNQWNVVHDCNETKRHQLMQPSCDCTPNNKIKKCVIILLSSIKRRRHPLQVNWEIAEEYKSTKSRLKYFFLILFLSIDMDVKSRRARLLIAAGKISPTSNHVCASPYFSDW